MNSNHALIADAASNETDGVRPDPFSNSSPGGTDSPHETNFREDSGRRYYGVAMNHFFSAFAQHRPTTGADEV